MQIVQEVTRLCQGSNMNEANLKLIDRNLGQIVQKYREASYQTAPAPKRQSQQSNNINNFVAPLDAQDDA